MLARFAVSSLPYQQEGLKVITAPLFHSWNIRAVYPLSPAFKSSYIGRWGLRMTHGRFLWARPGNGVFLTPTHHWPELSHMAAPDHEGGWEMKYSCEPRWQRKRLQ